MNYKSVIKSYVINTLLDILPTKDAIKLFIIIAKYNINRIFMI